MWLPGYIIRGNPSQFSNDFFDFVCNMAILQVANRVDFDIPKLLPLVQPHLLKSLFDIKTMIYPGNVLEPGVHACFGRLRIGRHILESIDELHWYERLKGARSIKSSFPGFPVPILMMQDTVLSGAKIFVASSITSSTWLLQPMPPSTKSS